MVLFLKFVYRDGVFCVGFMFEFDKWVNVDSSFSRLRMEFSLKFK